MQHVLAIWVPDFQNIIGLIILLVALLMVTALLVGANIGAMWGMNRLIPDKLTETTYGEFDLNNFQVVPFNNFLLRLSIVVGGPILVFHLLEYLLIFKNIIRAWWTIYFIMFVLVVSGIAALYFFIFRLDPLRLAILTGASALLYLILFPLMSSLGLFR